MHTIDGYKLVDFASQIEEDTIAQAKQTASMPFVYPHVALMPDAHVGRGSAVVTVIPTVDAVIPADAGQQQRTYRPVPVHRVPPR